MIRIIFGNKGSGKTKRLLDYTNEALKEGRGNIVFIDDDKRYMYDLHRDIRFVDASEYPAGYHCSASEFLGFICGMLSSNYDLVLIAIDAFKKLVKTELDSEEMALFFKRLDFLSERHGCDFIISISCAIENVPDNIAKYAV